MAGNVMMANLQVPKYMNSSLTREIVAAFMDLDESLGFNHASMSSCDNPVLLGLENGSLSMTDAEGILGQYCYLPAMIVELLSIAKNRFSGLTHLESELCLNIKEESGSRTGGISHYEILINGLFKELGFAVPRRIWAPTAEFLIALENSLNESTPSFVLGNVYGLENSAVPELSVVATIINAYAKLKGSECRLPNNFKTAKQLKNVKLNEPNLAMFFAMHILDFEVGHKNRLALATIKQTESMDFNVSEFKDGFEFVLDHMDSWWNQLAKATSGLPQGNLVHLDAARLHRSGKERGRSVL